jgi:hypothetical protein
MIMTDVPVSIRKVYTSVYKGRVGKFKQTVQQAKFKRTVMYRTNRVTGESYRTLYEEWEENGKEIKNYRQVFSSIPENEPRVHHAVSYDPDAVEDVTQSIKVFTSEEAADNYFYRTDNNENESGENTSNPNNA